jgi:hypothetical protein
MATTLDELSNDIKKAKLELEIEMLSAVEPVDAEDTKTAKIIEDRISAVQNELKQLSAGAIKTKA